MTDLDYCDVLDTYDAVADAMSAWGGCLPDTEKDAAASEAFVRAVIRLAKVVGAA